jgi:hypothetical protein
MTRARIPTELESDDSTLDELTACQESYGDVIINIDISKSCYIDEVMFDLSDRLTPNNGPIPR